MTTRRTRATRAPRTARAGDRRRRLRIRRRQHASSRHQRRRPMRRGERRSRSSGAVDTVGFIYVGPKDDFGYNQAAYEGSVAVQEAFPDVNVLQAENVPETAESEAVMQGMIDDGADLIFATSYGHLEFAANLAAANPEVVFVHQGGLETGAARQPRHVLRHGVRTRLHRGHRRRRRSARPASSATCTPSRSRRPWPTSTPSRSARSRSIPTSRRSRCRPAAGATRPCRRRRRRPSSTRAST